MDHQQQKRKQDKPEGIPLQRETANQLVAQLRTKMVGQEKLDLQRIKEIVAKSGNKENSIVNKGQEKQKGQQQQPCRGEDDQQEEIQLGENGNGQEGNIEGNRQSQRQMQGMEYKKDMQGRQQKQIMKGIQQQQQKNASKESIEEIKIEKELNDSIEIKGITKQSKLHNMEAQRYKQSQQAFRMSTTQSMTEEMIKQEIAEWEQRLHNCSDNNEQQNQSPLSFQLTATQMELNVQQLQTQFEICLSLSSKMGKKYQDLNSLLKGVNVFKVSRHNKNKAHLRQLYYAPSLAAFCWKAPKDLFPEKAQIVYLKDIREVRTQLDISRKLPKEFKTTQYFKISMIDRKSEDLEFICEDEAMRSILVGVIHELVEDLRKSRQNICLNNSGKDTKTEGISFIEELGVVEKYEKEIAQIKEQIESTRELFENSSQALRNVFVSAARSLLGKERMKRKEIQEATKRQVKENIKEREVIKEGVGKENQKLKEELLILQGRIEELAERENKWEGFFEDCAKIMQQVPEIKAQYSRMNKQYDNRHVILSSLQTLVAQANKVTEQMINAGKTGKYGNDTHNIHNGMATIKINDYLPRESRDMQDNYQRSLEDYNDLLDQKTQITEELSNVKIQLEDIQRENVNLASALERSMNQLQEKESEFVLTVEGLNMIRNDMLVEIENLQQQVKQQDEEIAEIKSKQQQPGEFKMKCNLLEKKLMNKEQLIKQLLSSVDALQEQLSSKEQMIENLTQTGEILVKENQNFKRQQQQDQLCQQNTKMYNTGNDWDNNNNNQYNQKENTHPNILNSELSFKQPNNKISHEYQQSFSSQAFATLSDAASPSRNNRKNYTEKTTTEIAKDFVSFEQQLKGINSIGSSLKRGGLRERKPMENNLEGLDDNSRGFGDQKEQKQLISFHNNQFFS